MFDVILHNHQTWLICGGRDCADQNMFDGARGDLIRLRGCPERVVHGGAKGADEMASVWGWQMGLQVVGIATRWDLHGKGAGPIRNQKMLDEYKPSLVVAFPGGRGTADMVKRSRAAGIDVAEIKSKRR